MFYIRLSLLMMPFVCVGMQVQAADDLLRFSIEEVLQSENGKKKMRDDIKLYFGTQSSHEMKSVIAKVKTNKKTNAFNKSDREACEWVFLSAVIALQDKARELEANAVINIKSNFKNRELDNAEKFECGSGFLMAGVALKGMAVKLGNSSKSGASEDSPSKSGNPAKNP